MSDLCAWERCGTPANPGSPWCGEHSDDALMKALWQVHEKCHPQGQAWERIVTATAGDRLNALTVENATLRERIISCRRSIWAIDEKAEMAISYLDGNEDTE